MKKTFKFIVLTLNVALTCAILSACNLIGGLNTTSSKKATTNGSDATTTSPSKAEAIKKEISLDAFDTVKLDVSELSGTIVYASSNESVVLVNQNGEAYAIGEEGTAKITATSSTGSIEFSVTVFDSGERPVISPIENIEVFTGYTYDLRSKLVLTYNGKTIEDGVTYQYTSSSDIISISEDGIITGVKAGTAQIKVTAEYRGYTTGRKQAVVEVKSATAIQQEDITLSVAKGDIDPQEITIAPVAYVNGEATDKAVSAVIKSGSDDVIVLEGLKITAKAVGMAVITLSFDNNGETITKDIVVTVHDDAVSYRWSNLQQADSNYSSWKTVRTEGDPHQGEYEYKALSIARNYWDSAITDSSTVTSITTEGYQSFAYSIYMTEIPAKLHFYVASGFISESGAYARYELVNGEIGDYELVYIYDANGNLLPKGTMLETNKWYRVVYDLTTYSDGWTMLGLSLDSTESKKDMVAYLKDMNYYTTTTLLPNGGYDNAFTGNVDDDPTITTEKDEFINGIEIASPNAVSVSKVISGQFEGAYKIRSITASYNARITFKYFSDGTTGDVGDFFKEGKHYIKFDVYTQLDNGFAVCNWLKEVLPGAEDLHIEGTLNSNGTLDTFTVYNQKGIKVNLNKDGWYTIVVEMDYETAPEWALFYIGIPGSKYAPGVAYIRNVEFLTEAPVIEADTSLIASVFTPDKSATLTKVNGELDGVEGAYLYESNGTWYPNILQVNNHNESSSYFSGKITSFKIRVTENSKFFYAFSYKNTYDGSYSGDTLRIYDENGNAVKASNLVTDKWYTVIIDETNTDEWFWYITTDNGSLYIADLKEVESDPYYKEPDTSVIASNFAAQEAATLTKAEAAVEGVEGAYLYASNGAWYPNMLQVKGYNTDSMFLGKITAFKVMLVGDSKFYYALDWTNTFDGSYKGAQVKIYNASGKQVNASQMASGAWYDVVVDLAGSSSFFWYVTTDGGSMYIADLRNVDSDPYYKEPDTSVIANNLIPQDAATLTKVDGAVEGVSGAYLYASNGAWYPNNITVKDFNTASMFMGKITAFKVMLVGDSKFYYALDWTNTYDGSYTGTQVKIYDAAGKAVDASQMKSGAWYDVVVDLAGSSSFFWYITTDGGSMYIADLRNVDSDPYYKEPEPESNVTKYLSTGSGFVSTLEYTGTAGQYEYKSNGNWWTGSLVVSSELNTLASGKYIVINFVAGDSILWNIVDGSGNSYQSTAASTIAIYSASGNAATSIEKGQEYALVIKVNSSISYISIYNPANGEGGSAIITDVRVADADPYYKEPDTSVIATNLLPQSAATLTKADGAVEGVEGAYLYASNGAWYPNNITVSGYNTDSMFLKKITAFKVMLVGDSRFYYALDWTNTFDGSYKGSQVKIYDAAGKAVDASQMKSGAWYDVVVDLAGSSSFFWYITTDGGSMYIADLRNVESDPYYKEPDTSVIATNLQPQADATLTKVDGAVGGIEGAYLYASNGAWYPNILQINGYNSDSIFLKKITAFKVMLVGESKFYYALDWTNTYEGSYKGAQVKIYDAAGKAVEAAAMAAGAWYDVVVDLAGSDSFFWYITTDGGSMYIADLRNVDSDPYYKEPEPESNVTKYLSTGSGFVSTLEYTGTAGQYEYKSNGNWWTGSLVVSSELNALASGKYIVISFVAGDSILWNIVDGSGNSYQSTAASTIAIYSASGNAATSIEKGQAYVLVIKVNSSISYISIYNPANGEGGSAIITDVTVAEADPYYKEPDTSVIATNILPQADATLTKADGAVEGVEGAYLYASNGAWYPNNVTVSGYNTNSMFLNKITAFKVMLVGDSKFYYALDWTNTFDGSYKGSQVKIYDASGKAVEAAAMASGAWYDVVVDLAGSDSFFWYITTDNGSMYIADLRNVESDPYYKEPDTSVIATNILPQESATLTKADGAVEGVEGAYLYASNGAWYPNNITVSGYNTDSMFLKKITAFKVMLVGDSKFYYALDWTNTFDGSYKGAQVKIYDAAGKAVDASQMKSGAWYDVVVDLAGSDSFFWYITTDNGSMYIADLRNVEKDPYYKEPEVEYNVTKYLTAGGSFVSTLEKTETAGTFEYKSNGNWWSGSLSVSSELITLASGKYITMTFVPGESILWNLVDASGNSYQSTAASTIAIYSASGNAATTIEKGQTYVLVIKVNAAISYISIYNPANGEGGSAILSNLEVVEKDPYYKEPDTSVIATNLLPQSSATLTKADGAVEGVEGSYLYASNGAWYPNNITVSGYNTDSMFLKKITAFKVMLVGDSRFYYALDWTNTFDGSYKGTQVKIYDAAGKAVDASQMKSGAWYDVVVDLAGSDSFFWYITTDGGSMYIADLRNVESDPYYKEPVDNGLIESTFAAQADGTLTKQTAAVAGVSNSYLYDSKESWYANRLEVINYGSANPVNGKCATVKVNLTEGSGLYYALSWQNTYDGSYTGSAVTVYDASGNVVAVNSMVAGTWYTVVIDLVGNSSDFFWYLTSNGSFYLADMQILDANPMKK